MKKMIFGFMAVVLAGTASHALPLTGLYQTIDDKTNTPKAIVALYEYPEKPGDDDIELAGRIVATYNADGKLATDSKFVGTDIIWGMEWEDDDHEYEDGKIKDPQNGKVYKCVIWQDKPGTLNVRGKLGPIGRTQVWRALSGDAVPAELKNLDTKNWRPTGIK